MISVNEAPIKQPMFTDKEKTQLHPVWVMYFTQLARVGQGKDESAVKADNADTVDTYHASQTPTANKILVAGSDATLPIQPIWDKTITGSAVTSVTTDGEVTLDGNTHGGYEFEFIVYNSTVSTVTLRLYVENDTTNTNYHELRYGFAWANDAIITDQLTAGRESRFHGHIGISPRGFVNAHLDERQDADYMSFWCWRKAATITNLTRIDIVSSVASGIGINSRFRLWRKK